MEMPASLPRYEKIFILGLGAVGLPLAAHLIRHGRNVVAVRTRPTEQPASEITVTIHGEAGEIIQVPVQTIPLASLTSLDGLIVVTTKSYANPAIAATLRRLEVAGPLVLLQNGLGVERPFLEAGFSQVHRGVLYMTSHSTSANEVAFRSIASSPVGPVAGDNTSACVAALTTPGFPFHEEPNIQQAIWKKATINVVFNSLCPLLDVDNGIFVRDAKATSLAHEVIRECIALSLAYDITLPESEIIAQIMKISRGSQGVLISTLQDLRHGRETEMEYLNQEMVRLASAAQPPIAMPNVELLGKLILAKARIQKARSTLADGALPLTP